MEQWEVLQNVCGKIVTTTYTATLKGTINGQEVEVREFGRKAME